MSPIAWLGLGRMGSRMAGRLLEAGHEVVVWNRSSGPARLVARQGARIAATPAEAVRSARAVFLMLADPAALRQVAEGPDGLAAGIGKGATVIDLSTVGPSALAALRAGLPDEVSLLDAPVLGSIAEAEAGTLILLVGGPSEAVTTMRPVLATLGEPIVLGPSGAGARAKLVANFVLLGVLGVLGEAVAMGAGLGLPEEATWRVLEQTPLAAQAARRRPLMEAGDYSPRFPLTLARKDAELIVASAESAGVDGEIAHAVRRWLSGAEHSGLGEQDYTVLLKHIRDAARYRSGAEG